MARRTGEETRALLLRVGMQMLLERGVAAGVQHIRLQEVLRRAGLTTGAAYRLWADQNDYQRDLAVAMVRLRIRSDPAEYPRGAIEDLVAAGAEGDDVIRVASAAHVQSITVDADGPSHDIETQQFLVALALRAAAETWPELLEATRERRQGSTVAFAQFYLWLMEAYGLRLRSPLTIEGFTELLAAMSEGFALRAIEGTPHPTVVATAADDVPEGTWTLFGLGVHALVKGLMVSVETNEHESEDEDRGSSGVE